MSLTPILYFGCLQDVGHYLWSKASGHYTVQIDHRAIKTATPWGFDIDYSIKGLVRTGIVSYGQKDGWSVIVIPDRSVDSRPGSHSTFAVQALLSKDELIANARAQWPEVFNRPQFPALS